MDALTVKAISLMTGITTHTLRAWEKRYQAISPRRTDSGRRYYTYDDVHKLRLLLQMTQRGYSIGQIAQCSQDELEKLLQRHNHEKILMEPTEAETESTPSNIRKSKKTPSFLDELDRAMLSIKKYDVPALDRVLKEVELNTAPHLFILNFMSPLFQAIGQGVENGKIDIAQEHLASSLLKNHLTHFLYKLEIESHIQGQVFTPNPKGDTPPILFATPEGQLHEFGILCSSVLAAIHQFKILYLGCNLPAHSLIKAAHSVKAKIIVLGLLPGGGSPDSAGQLNQYCFEMGQGLKAPTKIYLGGGGTEARSLLTLAKKRSKIPHQWQHLSDFQAWIDELLSLR